MLSPDKDGLLWILWTIGAGLLLLWLSLKMALVGAAAAPAPTGPPKRLLITPATEWVCTRYASPAGDGVSCKPALDVAWWILMNGPKPAAETDGQ